MRSKNATKQFRTKTKVSNGYKDIFLDGVEALRANRFTKTIAVTHELHPKTSYPFRLASKKLVSEELEPLRFNLMEVTPEELYSFRKSQVSSFVLKVDGKLYYTNIPHDLNLVSSAILGAHKCAIAGHECKRLSAASDENGGCAKVRKHSKYIERYPWIKTGYETFNTERDSFVVVSCSHYEECPPRKNFSLGEINSAKLALAQFIWDDVKDLADVKAKKAKNKA